MAVKQEEKVVVKQAEVVEDTAIATRPSTGMSTGMDRPDWLAPADVIQPRGFDEMTGSDIILPRLVLCQSGNPQRKAANEKYIKGLEEGQLFNSFSEQIYGTWVKVQPLYFFKSRIYFKDYDEGGGIICQAPDGRSCQLNNGGPCINANWGPKGEPPACSELFNYPCLLHSSELIGDRPNPELVVVSFKSTGLAKAKFWNSLIRQRGADIFAGLFKLSVVPERKKNNDYFNIEIDNAEERWVTKENHKYGESQYSMIHDGLARGTVRVDTDGIAEESGRVIDADM